MHVDIWQNQYNIVKFKNKIKYILKKRFRTKKKKKRELDTTEQLNHHHMRCTDNFTDFCGRQNIAPPKMSTS